jgi:hypothetical protein
VILPHRRTIAPSHVRTILWPVIAVLVSMVPLAGAFSTTNVFYVRDLGMYFWPRHLWLRQSWHAGDWPLWDPYAAAGQSAVADALNQFFLLPVTLVRLLAPDVVGFNLWIAAPFPLIALGAWLWLRRSVSPAAACVGAAFLTVSGPVVSSGNFPNLSWAVAMIPWALWLTDRVLDRPGLRPIAALAVCVALQAVAGEPVTLAATGVLLLAYAAATPNSQLHNSQFGSWLFGSWQLWRRISRVGAALPIGALLSAVQLLPLLSAASRSPRSDSPGDSLWSLHPLAFLETGVAHLFGHAYDGSLDRLPWVGGINQREPLFFTMYVGLGALVLAMIGPNERRRERTFWWVVAAVALICALGDHTPIYPALQSVIPVLRTFRFPVKYLIFSVIALAALAACGVDALLAQTRAQGSMAHPRVPLAVAGAVSVLAALAALVSVLQPAWMRAFWAAVARVFEIPDPAAAAAWIIGPSTPLLAGLALFAAAAAMLLVVVWQRHAMAPLAAAALCVVAIVDPLMINLDVHPTIAASSLGPPAWASVTRAHPGDRVYVGGRVARRLGPRFRRLEAIDVPARFEAPAELASQEAAALLSAQFAYDTAAWGLRESVSYDLAQLWPREYTMMTERFRRASREERLRFVQRTGVRYCFLPEPPAAGDQPLAMPSAPSTPMALYECGVAPRRVYVTARALVVPDLREQIDRLFDAQFDPGSTSLLEAAPPEAAGLTGDGAGAADASVVRERNTELVVAASVPAGGGYLNVIDTYDPDWIVDVDGRRATLLRGNGLYRAVRLTPGLHEVRFTYRPRFFYAGLVLTLATALALAAGCVRAWLLTVVNPARRMRQAVSA